MLIRKNSKKGNFEESRDEGRDKRERPLRTDSERLTAK